MFVGERMSHPVITIHKEMPIQEALQMMRTEHIRRLPVVGPRGELVGMVTEKDLLNASPSEATTLSVWELNYLLSKITVERIMVHDVITVTESTPIEEAARVMADHKVGSLPVLRDRELVGIITETDLFKLFLELLGARESGIRLTVMISDIPGKLHELTGAVQAVHGNIISLGTFLGETSENRIVTMKVAGVEAAALEREITPVVERVIDIRKTIAA